MKKLIFVFLAGAITLTSCNKEKKLENRLDGKWKIESQENSVKMDVSIDYETNTVGLNDTSYTTEYPNANLVITTTGEIDFVSDSKLIIAKNIETKETKTTDGTTTTTTTVAEEEEVAEYYISGEDEVTVITVDEDGGQKYMVYDVTTNEKDAQVWEYQDVETDTDDSSIGSIDYTKKTITTTKVKITLSVVED